MTSSATGDVPEGYVPTFAEQAALSRQLAFPNRATEDAVLGEFDHRLTQAVRQIEAVLVGQAENMRDRINEMATAAEEATVVFREIQLDLNDDEEVDLDRLSRASAALDRITANAEKYPARLAVLTERMDDPVRYASELQSKYPALHRPYLLKTE